MAEIIYPRKLVVGTISHGGIIPEIGRIYFVSMNDARSTGNTYGIEDAAHRCEVDQSTRVVTCTNSVRQDGPPETWFTAASVANYLVIL